MNETSVHQDMKSGCSKQMNDCDRPSASSDGTVGDVASAAKRRGFHEHRWDIIRSKAVNMDIETLETRVKMTTLSEDVHCHKKETP